MGNTNSNLNLENLEFIKVHSITRKDAELTVIEDTHNFIDIDGTLRFNTDDGMDFFCDFTYDRQVTNTLLVYDEKPIEYDDEKLINFIILSCEKKKENIYEMSIKLDNHLEIEKLILNVKNIYR